MEENTYLLKHTAAIHIINSLSLTQRKVWEKSSVSNPASSSSAIYIDLSKIDKDFCGQERKTLVKKFGTKTYASWFENVNFEETRHKELLIKAPSPFCADYIKINFSNVIPKAWKKMTKINQQSFHVCLLNDRQMFIKNLQNNTQEWRKLNKQ
jgi:hypothetical protein